LEYTSMMNIETLQKSFTETNWSVVYTIDANMLGQHATNLLELTYWFNNLYDTMWCSCTDENAEEPLIVIRLFPNNGGLDELDKIKPFSKRLLADTSFKNIKNIEKCVFDPITNCIDTIGIDMGSVMADERVDAGKTTCNDVVEIFNILGIEAARETLVREIKQVIEFDGSYVDYRHISVLVDTMTYKGSIMAITRHGINRTETGVLMRCSFEETVNIITDAAMHAEYDPIRGVTENIIMGKTAKVGTGLVDVLFDIDKLTTIMMEESEQQNQETPTPTPTPTGVQTNVSFRPSTPSRDQIDYEMSFFPLKE
jgi:DNA-directed RNA polymerase II subunit RPB1